MRLQETLCSLESWPHPIIWAQSRDRTDDEAWTLGSWEPGGGGDSTQENLLLTGCCFQGSIHRFRDVCCFLKKKHIRGKEPRNGCCFREGGWGGARTKSRMKQNGSGRRTTTTNVLIPHPDNKSGRETVLNGPFQNGARDVFNATSPKPRRESNPRTTARGNTSHSQVRELKSNKTGGSSLTVVVVVVVEEEEEEEKYQERLEHKVYKAAEAPPLEVSDWSALLCLSAPGHAPGVWRDRRNTWLLLRRMNLGQKVVFLCVKNTIYSIIIICFNCFNSFNSFFISEQTFTVYYLYIHLSAAYIFTYFHTL